MYLDVKGLVTTAIGNLIDTPGEAMNLPFVHKDGTPATREQILDEWHYVKSRQDLKLRGGMVYERFTSLRLTPEGVMQVVLAKVAQMETHLSGRFPEWEEWPWQAQMATLSMAWAAGPALHAPHWEMAVRTQDWAMAAVESHLEDSHNPGLVPRNAANKALFLEAAAAHTDDTPASETNASETLEGTACH